MRSLATDEVRLPSEFVEDATDVRRVEQHAEAGDAAQERQDDREEVAEEIDDSECFKKHADDRPSNKHEYNAEAEAYCTTAVRNEIVE